MLICLKQFGCVLKVEPVRCKLKLLLGINRVEPWARQRGTHSGYSTMHGLCLTSQEQFGGRSFSPADICLCF